MKCKCRVGQPKHLHGWHNDVPPARLVESWKWCKKKAVFVVGFWVLMQKSIWRYFGLGRGGGSVIWSDAPWQREWHIKAKRNMTPCFWTVTHFGKSASTPKSPSLLSLTLMFGSILASREGTWGNPSLLLCCASGEQRSNPAFPTHLPHIGGGRLHPKQKFQLIQKFYVLSTRAKIENARSRMQRRTLLSIEYSSYKAWILWINSICVSSKTFTRYGLQSTCM